MNTLTDKMFMKKIIFAMICGALMSSCDSSVTDFVKGGGDPLRAADPARIVANAAPEGIKMSPGHVTSSATDVSMEATVTPTNRVLSSGDMSMSVTIGRGRVSTQ